MVMKMKAAMSIKRNPREGRLLAKQHLKRRGRRQLPPIKREQQRHRKRERVRQERVRLRIWDR
jgi:hypothetical protein